MSGTKDLTPEADSTARRLIARYCHLVDDGDFDAAGDLFAEDGRFVALGNSIEGRDSIVKMLAETGGTRTTLHQVTNIVVSNGSQQGTLHAVADVTLVAKVDGTWRPAFVGRYHDTFVGSGREARFTQRILTAR